MKQKKAHENKQTEGKTKFIWNCSWNQCSECACAHAHAVKHLFACVCALCFRDNFVKLHVIKYPWMCYFRIFACPIYDEINFMQTCMSFKSGMNRKNKNRVQITTAVHHIRKKMRERKRRRSSEKIVVFLSVDQI